MAGSPLVNRPLKPEVMREKKPCVGGVGAGSGRLVEYLFTSRAGAGSTAGCSPLASTGGTGAGGVVGATTLAGADDAAALTQENCWAVAWRMPATCR